MVFDFKYRFDEVCDELNLPSEGYYDICDINYSHRDRHQHNWQHIESVVDRVAFLARELGFSGRNVSLLKFAAIYHDVIYVPGFNRNEHLSAVFAAEHLAAGEYNSEQIKAVKGWILDTTKHNPNTVFGAILCDADLYELAVDYEGQRKKVRKEFWWVTPAQWIEGRTSFLTDYSNRSRLFFMPGQEGLEERVKISMITELNALNGGIVRHPNT